MTAALLSTALACAGPALQLARPDDLPERVLFRTATQDFNREWYAALRDGRIWIKPNPESGQFEGDWELLGDNGLPQGCGLVRHGPPAQIVELSIDGIHLMALSDEGVFYRAENAMQDPRSWIQWEDRWGGPAGTGDGLTAEFSTARGWSVGDSNVLDVEVLRGRARRAPQRAARGGPHLSPRRKRPPHPVQRLVAARGLEPRDLRARARHPDHG